MRGDPELLGLLAVVEARIETCLTHPELRGINRRAMRGALGCVQHVRTRLLLPEEPVLVRPLCGIERSVPQGDRE